MAGLAVGIAGASVLAGLQISFVMDTPTGPTIVCTAALLFAATSTLTLFQRT